MPSYNDCSFGFNSGKVLKISNNAIKLFYSSKIDKSPVIASCIES